MVVEASNLSVASVDSAPAAPYTQEGRPNTFPPSAASSADFTAAAAAAVVAAHTPNGRSANFPPDYLARQHHFTPVTAAASMAQAPSPSLPLSDGEQLNHSPSKSNSDVPIDPSIAATSPTYAGAPYSPYTPQGHEMPQYPGHPPQSYPGWPYPGAPHGLAYSSPGGNSSAAGSPATTGPPRPGQVSLVRLR